MKKLMNVSFMYFIFAMIGGVFFREFTKFHDFVGETALSTIHTHLLVLGTFLFLIIALFCRGSKLQEHKAFKNFFILYNIGLPIMVIMMLIRGIVQVQMISLTSSVNAMISGFSGIAHMLMLIAFILLFKALKLEFSETKE